VSTEIRTVKCFNRIRIGYVIAICGSNWTYICRPIKALRASRQWTSRVASYCRIVLTCQIHTDYTVSAHDKLIFEMYSVVFVICTDIYIY